MMDVPPRIPQQASARLRVLVADNDLKVRGRHTELLEMWGYRAIVAEGVGNALLEDAVQKARAYRCQLALVDMHLRDDHDKRDWSGLELVSRLAPAVSIIVSASGSREAVRVALRRFEAFSFVGKDEGPEKLLETIEEAVQSIASGWYRPKITWSVRGGSAKITKQICSNDPNVPEDAVEEAIGRLFPKARRVTLTILSSMRDSSSHVSGLRRRSRVFLTKDYSRMAACVVKLGRVEKIRNEIHNYERYVQFNLPAMYRPEKIADILLWDVGAVAYSYIGNNGLDTPNGPQTFFNFYRATTSTEDILMPLQHFFDARNWGVYYTFGVAMLNQSLFEAYDASWNGALNNAFERWCAHEPIYSFPGVPAELPNATRWLTDHVEICLEVENPREAVTHGDLHTDNLFVDRDRAWPIDFERTGPGPILRDFAELIQDIVTRAARFEDRDLPAFYELAIAICAPQKPNEPMRLTEAIHSNEQALKAFQVVQQLQLLAHEHTRYTDRREYLWGLLFHCLFVVRLLSESDPRHTRTLLLAGVLCRRLERWWSSAPGDRYS